MKYYRIFVFEASRGFNHVRLEVHDPKWKYGVYAFQWQETQGEEGIYAGRFHIESSDYKAILSFTRKFDIYYYQDFSVVIEALKTKGYVLAEYCDEYTCWNGYRHQDLVCADWIDENGLALHRRFYAGLYNPENKGTYLTGGCDPGLGKSVKKEYGDRYRTSSGMQEIHSYTTPVKTERFQQAAKLLEFYNSK